MSKLTLMPENKIGLYDPSLEKDACGVGFIVSIEREETNKVLTDAKTMLIRMAHR
jgi:glutamate synthase (NADPH/NADH)